MSHLGYKSSAAPRLSGSVAVIVSALIAIYGFDASADEGPSGTVRALYSSYRTDGGNPGRGLTSQTAGKLLSKGLMSLYRRAAASGNFDIDFFTQSQDGGPSGPVDIASIDASALRAHVKASFGRRDYAKSGKSSLRTETMVFDMKKEAIGWRIDDAHLGDMSVRKEWQSMIQGR